jgi:hypothetical protein
VPQWRPPGRRGRPHGGARLSGGRPRGTGPHLRGPVAISGNLLRRRAVVRGGPDVLVEHGRADGGRVVGARAVVQPVVVEDHGARGPVEIHGRGVTRTASRAVGKEAAGQ